MLDTSTWKEFRIEKIFDIINGKGITTTEIEENPGELVAVQSSESQNGCMGYINKEYCINMNYKMTDKPCLTVARTGSVAFVSYQPNGCVVGDSAKILLLKDRDKISNGVMLFLKTILTLLRERYNFARKVTEDIYGSDIIKLPVKNTGGKAVIDENYKYSDDGYVPDYQFMEDFIKSQNGDVSSIPDYFKNEGYDKACWYLDNIDVEKFENEYAGRKEEKRIRLSDRKWKEFNLSVFFDITPGIYHSGETYFEGDTPYISSKEENNGVKEFISIDAEFHGNSITTTKIHSVAFYQENKFCATADVNVYIPKFNNFNKYVGMFVVSIINFSQNDKWNYGRQCRMGDSKKININLPVNNEGKPDWQFMENYIKSLPFSCKL